MRDVVAACCAEQDRAELAVIGSNEIVRIAVGVHVQEPPSDQYGGALVPLEEVLCGGDLVYEHGRGIDSIGDDASALESCCDEVEVVVLGTR